MLGTSSMDTDINFDEGFSNTEIKYGTAVIQMQEKLKIMESNDNLEESATKLQPINIPTFSGDYQSWKTFSDIFIII